MTRRARNAWIRSPRHKSSGGPGADVLRAGPQKALASAAVPNPVLAPASGVSDDHMVPAVAMTGWRRERTSNWITFVTPRHTVT